MTIYTVSSGSTSSGVTLGAGDFVYVLAGGSAVSATVNAGGSAVVSAGGVASATTIAAGGSATVLAGGSDNLATIAGAETVLGAAVSATVLAGGSQTVSSGGLATATVVSSGGAATVLSGGVGSGVIVNGGGSETVSAGGVARTEVVNAGGNETILGSAVSGLIRSGIQTVSSGGVTSAVTVSSGGLQLVMAGGLASGTILSSGGSQTISSGGLATATIALSGGTQTVMAGGIVSGGTISTAARSVVSSGGVASRVTLARGSLTLLSGAVASGTVVNTVGNEIISSGGLALGTTIAAGGTETVNAGGTTSGLVVSATGILTVSAGGVVSGATLMSGVRFIEVGNVVSSGATMTLAPLVAPLVNFSVPAGGTVSNVVSSLLATVQAGGTVVVSAGGVDSTTTLSGGALIVSSGAFGTSAFVLSGGIATALRGGGIFAATVSSGGSAIASSGGMVSASTVRAGGTLMVMAGGSGYANIVSSGGVQFVSSGGLASATTVRIGGSQTLLSGATGATATISTGGNQIVSSGATATTTTVLAGGIVTIYIGALLPTISVVSTSVIAEVGQTVVNGGTMTLTAITAAGVVNVGAGGLTSNVVSGISTTVGAGGTLLVSSGGVASATIVAAGGTAVVSSGGVASATGLAAGGTEFVSAGGIDRAAAIAGSQTVIGLVSAASITSGGVQTIAALGIASATAVSSGGTEIVLTGGVASSGTILGGGVGVVSGGTYKSATVSSGGLLSVSTGLASVTTILAGGSAVVYAGGSGNAATLSSGGALTVYAGGIASAARVLSGGSATVYVGALISASTFSAGAQITEVGMTVVSAASMVLKPIAAAVAQTIAVGGTVSNIVSAINTTVLSGGSVTVSSGGFARATQVSGGGTEIVSSGGFASGSVVSSGGNETIYLGATISGASWNAGARVTQIGALTVGAGATMTLAPLAAAVSNVTVAGTGTTANLTSAVSASVASGGAVVVGSGGGATTLTVSGGGSVTVSSGGVLSAVTLLSGGTETVVVGGLATSTTVNSGAILSEVGMTVVGGTTMTLKPLLLTSTFSIAAGGTTSNVVSAISTTVNSAATLVVSSGGFAGSTTVNGGGALFISSGGADSGTTLLSGAAETILSGGVARATVVSGGGSETLYAGGSLSGVTLRSGAILTEVGFVVSGGGSTLALAAVTATLTDIGAGTGFVPTGAVSALSASVLSGGALVVSSGGFSRVTSVGAGGTLTVSAGGTDSASTVLSGGSERVSSGGVANAIVVASGGVQTLLAGGVASGTVLSAGGTILVSGGTLSGAAGFAVSAGAAVAGFGTIVPSVSGAGTITARGGTLDIVGSLAAGPVLVIDASTPATLEIGGTAAATAAIALTSSNQTLRIDAGGTLTETAAEIVAGATIALAGTLSDTAGLTLGAGSLLTGSGTVGSTTPLILAGGTVVGTGTGLHATNGLSGHGTILGTLAAGAGTLAAAGGVLQILGTIAAGEALAINGAASSVLDLATSVGSSSTVTFLGAAGVLELASGPSTFAGTIAGLTVGHTGTVPTNYVNVQGTTVQSAVLTGNTITLMSGGLSVGTLTLSGPPAAGTYAVVQADATLGGTDIFLANQAPTIGWSQSSVTGASASVVSLGTLLPVSYGASQTVTIAGLPVGATLSDGVNTYTASGGHTSVVVSSWSLSNLTVTTAYSNFNLSATVTDIAGNVSTAATEAVTVSAAQAAVVPVSATGLEGAAISLNLGVTVGGVAGNSGNLASLIVAGVPVGAILSDGTNSFTASAGNASVDIRTWNLNALTVLPSGDANFSLGVTATSINDPTAAIANAAVTVTPLAPTVAPVASTGVEGAAIALDFGISVNGLPGDSNSLASLISAIPVGAILSDGVNSFTATAGTTSIDVSSWSLSHLTIAAPNANNFVLDLSATSADSNGDLSTTTLGTETVTVAPLTPSVSAVAVAGVEGTTIPLNFSVVTNGLAGDSNSLSSLVVGAIPAGATLSDGAGHTFTATAGSTSIDVQAWTWSGLRIALASDANFTLTFAAVAVDADGNLSATATATEGVTVGPPAPTLSPVAASGAEGTAIALNLGVTVNGAVSDTNTLSALVVDALPIGAVLSDGVGHSFTATAGARSVDVHGWTWSGLTVVAPNNTNFTLGIAATTVDGDGNLSATATANEPVTVLPAAPSLAPATVSGVEGASIALDVGLAVSGLSGDSNRLSSLLIDGVPVGDVLSDGAGHSFTATAGATSVDVHTWSLSGLRVVTVNDTNFQVSVSATAADAEGDLSATTVATETIAVVPFAPSVSPAAASGIEGSAIALSLGVSVGGLAGDSNSLSSLVLGAIPLGAVVSDGAGHSFTATAGTTSVDVHAWTLAGLQIVSAGDANFVLTVAAVAADGDGDTSATTTATQAVTVAPFEPTVSPVAAVGVQGTAIALDLGVVVNSGAGDSNTLSSLVVSAIPAAAVLSDGTNSFTASAGTASVNIATWNLANLSIASRGYGSFVLNVAAATTDGDGNVSSAVPTTEAVTVNPLTPVFAPVPAIGVEGTIVPLNLGLTINGAAPSSSNLAAFVVSGIPVGATLSDGVNSYNAIIGNTAADISNWTLSNLRIQSSLDVNFSLNLSATAVDAAGNLGATTTSTESVTLAPPAPNIAPVAPTGVEGTAITLNLGVTVSTNIGDYNSLSVLTASGLPVGVVLTDGFGHSFTATAGSTSVDLHSWTLTNLKITTPSDANFTIGLLAGAVDGEGDLSATRTGSVTVTVNPLAPAVSASAASGVEGTAIALNIGATANSLSADGSNNSLASLVVSGIPVGDVLSDGAGHSFTAVSGGTSVDVHAWTLAGLNIVPVSDSNFTLTVAATGTDNEGNLSTAVTTTALVTVNPSAPTVSPVGVTGTEGSAFALNLGVAVTGGAADSNSLASLVVGAIPVGAVLSDGAGHSFTATAGTGSTDVHAWTLSGLKIAPSNDANFTLTVAATEVDGDGNLSTTASATETVTVNPLPPTVSVGAVSGLEGASIALNVGVVVNSLTGDSNSLSSLVVGAIPAGAVLSDGAGHSFTATAGSTTVDVRGWTLSGLRVLPSSATNMALLVTATETDADGNQSSATATETVTVTPLAPTVSPVAASGVEASPIALNLGVAVQGLSGDSNSLSSLVVGAIPTGAVLSDGAGHSFTATAGTTSIDVHGWTLAGLRIVPAGDTNFTLTVAATVHDGEGNLSTTTSATEAVTVAPRAPTVSPVAASGVEGSPIALNLGMVVTNGTGDSNSLLSLGVSAIPVGAVLSDGAGHSFTATAGTTSVDVHAWTYASLSIVPVNDTNFVLSIAATEVDGDGDLSTTASATETVTVNPTPPTVSPISASGVEGSPIALNLGVVVNGGTAGGNTLASIVVSAIPAGDVLSDGAGHSFTATVGTTSADVHAWTLSGLQIVPSSDTNTFLLVTATVADGEGNQSSAFATETVTVAPLAPSVSPVAGSGVEGSPIGLNLGVSVNSLAGDANSLSSLVVGAIPVGDVLTDGAGHSFTATAGTTSVDVHGWTLGGLNIVPVNDTNFVLTVAATETDSDGNPSATVLANETVTVAPLAPTVSPVAASGVEGSAIGLNLGVAVNGLTGDANSLSSLVVGAIPVGDVLSDGAGHSFTATAGTTSVDVHGWTLGGLNIVPVNDTNFVLTVAATETDSDGNPSATVLANETVTVAPLAPSVSPVAASGVEGSAIGLNLGVSVNSLGGDSNNLSSLVVGAIPVGDVLSDGAGHSFTATAGTTSVDVHGWTLGGLNIVPVNDTNFVLTVAATETDSEGNPSATVLANETVTVAPLAPTVSPVAASGVEGSAIGLNLGVAVNGLTGDANSLSSLVVGAIPVGDVLSDGAGHSFTATAGTTSVDVHGWTLGGLNIVPVNDTNFVLTVAATETDGEGNPSATVSANETVTVAPLAPTVSPVAGSGVEGSAIGLNLGVSVNSLGGDSNSLSSLVVGAIPVGDVLTDGAGHSFTATAGTTSVDVHGWTLGGLNIVPVNDTNFVLTVAATETDSEGNPSATVSANETVTVAPLAPSVSPVAASGVQGSPIGLNLGVSVNSLGGDSNNLASLVVGAIPVGDVLTDGAGHSFTATNGHTSADVSNWELTALAIAARRSGSFALTVDAVAKDGEHDLSVVVTASETVTVAALTPVVSPVVATGVEGSAIALHLGVTVNGATGSAANLAALVIDAIPVGATLSDGIHTFVATAGTTSVDVAAWSLGSLSIAPTNDANFTLGIAATAMDAAGDTGGTATATEAVTVKPLAPAVSLAATGGVEGSAIALNPVVTVNSRSGDSNSLSSLVVGAIPVGDVLSDGAGHSFTAAAGTTSVDVFGWTLSGLNIVPLNAADFTLTIAATATDREADVSQTTTGNETVVVSPLPPILAPIAASGTVGSPIALDLGVSANILSGDCNTLSSLVVSGIPVGADLTDGVHDFVASVGQTSVDIAGWNLADLTIAPITHGALVLGLAAISVDRDGQFSAISTADEPVAVCYAAGTGILTEAGERPVETLRAGDRIATFEAGAVCYRAVDWVGYRRIDLTTHPRPEAVAPVRIARGAVADNIPHADLVVSPDHAIYIGGQLICARQLINGTTIRREAACAAVEYYHIELSNHAILFAEGLTAESYLDTGNRGFFENGDEPSERLAVISGEDDFPARGIGSCAPFVWKEADVQPVWRRLANRAAMLGYARATPRTTREPTPRAIAGGKPLLRLSGNAGRYSFMVPRSARAVRLLSRHGFPTDTRPWLDDRRRLGLYVDRIILRCGRDVLDVPLDHPALSSGWWAPEREGREIRRWTDGDALLPLPDRSGPAVLEVHTARSSMEYLTD